MIGEHWCWWLLAMACVVWYSTITVYVAIKGAGDIKQMLKRLAAEEESSSSPPAEKAS
jgi:hypothetical protein